MGAVVGDAPVTVAEVPFNPSVIKGASNPGSIQGFYQDANGKWYRSNGQFTSNAKVGISKTTTSATNRVHGYSLAKLNANYG